MSTAQKRRRVRGEGGVRQRVDGRWEACLHLPDGRRTYHYAKTQKEVRDWLVARRRELQLGEYTPPDRQTLGEFLQHWLTDSVKVRVRPKTYSSYESLVRVHVMPTPLARRPLQGLTPQELQAWLNARVESGTSPRLAQYIHAVLRSALEQAYKWLMVPRNIAKLVDPPRVQRHEVQPLTPEQAGRLLRAAEEDRLYALYAVAVALGLRQGEILALRWEDIDIESRTLRVCRTVQRVRGRLVFGEPKSNRSRRSIGLPDIAVNCLRQHQVRQKLDRLVAGERWQDHDLVFCTTIGTPIEASNLQKHLLKLLERADLPRVRFHDLRHTCASLLLAQGLSPRSIMEVLGHSQISLTMDTYAHIMPELRREAADAMDRALGSIGIG